MKRHEVLLAGVGGGGVLLAGEFLAKAATAQYKNVSWYPYYGAQQRGGPSQCFVIFSDREIASPYVSKPEAVVSLEQSQFKPFESWVQTGGAMITESLELKDEGTRSDIKIFKVPAIKTAVELGERRSSNFVLLGAYIGAIGSVSPGLIEKEIEQKFGDSKATEVNKEAFQKGIKIGAA